VALTVSVIAFVLILGLDKIGDGDLTSDSVEKALRQLIMALAILVGFGWEQSFDIAVEALSLHMEIFHSQGLAKFLISVVLVGIVAPAWKRFIIPAYMRLHEQHEHNRESAWEEYDAIAHKGTSFHKFHDIPDDAGIAKHHQQRSKERLDKLSTREKAELLRESRKTDIEHGSPRNTNNSLFDRSSMNRDNHHVNNVPIRVVSQNNGNSAH